MQCLSLCVTHFCVRRPCTHACSALGRGMLLGMFRVVGCLCCQRASSPQTTCMLANLPTRTSAQARPPACPSIYPFFCLPACLLACSCVCCKRPTPHPHLPFMLSSLPPDQALVTDIDPAARVKDAMNEIQTAQRMRQAAAERAEADKVTRVKAAEAEAEARYLQVRQQQQQRIPCAATLCVVSHS